MKTRSKKSNRSFRDSILLARDHPNAPAVDWERRDSLIRPPAEIALNELLNIGKSVDQDRGYDQARRLQVQAFNGPFSIPKSKLRLTEIPQE